jgi:hypothetical protein
MRNNLCSCNFTLVRLDVKEVITLDRILVEFQERSLRLIDFLWLHLFDFFIVFTLLNSYVRKCIQETTT